MIKTSKFIVQRNLKKKIVKISFQFSSISLFPENLFIEPLNIIRNYMMNSNFNSMR